MLSLNPRTDLAEFIFDDKFWVPSICKKYDDHLKSKNYPIDDIREMVAESLKTFEIPGMSSGVTKQLQFVDGRPIETNTPDNVNKLQALGKTLQLTFRHTDGYMTYWCLWEHMNAKLDKDKALVVSDFPMIVRNMYGQKMLHVIYKNALCTGIDGLLIDYQNFERSAKEFTMTWELDRWSVEFTPPRQAVKGYNPESNSTFDLTDNSTPDDPIPNPPRPSL